MGDGLQSPYSDAVAPTPSGSPAGGGTSGGWDVDGGRKETPNMSGVNLLPTTTDIEGAPNGQHVEVGMPTVDDMGTIPTKETGGR